MTGASEGGPLNTSVSLQRRCAVVTGAASGIGHAITMGLVERGWCVLAADAVVRDGTPVEIKQIEHVVADISLPDEVRQIYSRALNRFDRVDAVVNCAGVTLNGDARLEDVDEAVFDRVLAVNLRGTFLMCREGIAPLRRASGGAIVNIGSVASLRGVGGTAYVASKAAIAGLSRAIAYQYAADGIRCNTVAPGATDTPMLTLSRSKTTAQPPSTPRGIVPGLIDPKEIAALVAFLVSDAGRHVTGATYVIDAGFTQH